MKHLIAAILRPVAHSVYTLVAAIPMWAVWTLVFGVLAALALWVAALPPQLPGKSEDEKAFSLVDLRVFALFILALQAVLYVVF